MSNVISLSKVMSNVMWLLKSPIDQKSINDISNLTINLKVTLHL
jgi:hypothetical protein